MCIDLPLVGFLIIRANVLRKNSWTNYFSNYVNILIDLGKKLEEEKVPNVLITFLAEYPKFKVNLNSQSKKEFQVFVKKIRDEKDDEDVLYYISKADEWVAWWIWFLMIRNNNWLDYVMVYD